MILRRVLIALAAMSALLVLPPVKAQSDDAAQSDASEQEIVVSATKATALRDLRSVLGLVDGYVTRFDETFCPAVMGLDAELTKAITKRILANAAAVGLNSTPGLQADRGRDLHRKPARTDAKSARSPSRLVSPAR